MAGTIRGSVQDSASGLLLRGVRVSVTGTSEVADVNREVVTESGGRFSVGGLTPGVYTVRASYLGYPDLRETVDIETISSKIRLNLDFSRDEIVEMGAFSVEGSLVGSAKALNRQRSAHNIKNVVASDEIGQFVDRNAAEALSRLPGISVEDSQGEGKFVIIRGADPSLNSISIDGVTVATPEEDGRSTSLDIISIDQLESIEVTKSWLPDQSANFIGGSVNLLTQSALDRERRFASLEAALTQHTISNSGSYRFNASYGDILGSKKNIGIQISYNRSEDNRGSDELRADDWLIEGSEIQLIDPPIGFFMRRLKLRDFVNSREHSGLSGKLEYRLDENHRFRFSVSLNQIDDDEVLQETQFYKYRAREREGHKTFSKQIAFALGYDPNDPAVASRVDGTADTGKRIFFSEAVQLGDFAWNPKTRNFTLVKGGQLLVFKKWQNTITADEIVTYQIGAKHRLGEWLDFDYRYFTSDAEKNWTERRVTLQAGGLGGTFIMGEGYFPQVVQNAEVNLINDPARYRLNRYLGSAADNVFSSTDDRHGFEVNLQTTYQFRDFAATTKIGGHFDFREKEFLRDFNRFSTVEVEPLPQISLADSEFGGGVLVLEYLPDRPEYNFGPSFDTAATNAFFDDPGDVEFVEEHNDVTFNVCEAILKNYLADEDVFAGYFMQTLEKGSLRITAGLRFEETRNSFTNREILTRPEGLPVSFVPPGFWNSLPLDAFSRQVTSEKTYNHVLPAVHFRKELGEKTVVRASYTETIARPKFTDLVPREIVSIDGAQFGNSVQLPNFDLVPMESTNFDLSYERYFEGLGLVTVAGFYKKLEGPIYLERRTVDCGTELSRQLAEKYRSSGKDTTDWETTKWQNAGGGKILSVELAFERKFNFLPEPFDGFGLAFNTAFIDSSTQLLLEERFGEDVPMFRQSSNMGNLSVYYEKFGLLVRLALAWRGKYLDGNGIRGGRQDIRDLTREDRLNLPADSLDIYVDDFKKLDLTIKYRFRDHFAAFFEATNLTDEPLRRYTGDISRLHSIQFTGPIYSFGVKWNL